MRLSNGLQLSDELTNNALEEMMLAATRLMRPGSVTLPALYVDREIAELHLRVFLEDVIGSQEAIRRRLT